MSDFRNNPTELIEDFILTQDWAYQRMSPYELAAEVDGRWGIYRLQFYWQAEESIFHLSCFLDIKIPDKSLPQVYELLSLVNERLLVGHFELFSDERLPAYRYSFMLAPGSLFQPDLLEQAIVNALEETDRFYPAFQTLLAGDKNALEAASIASLDIAGEA